MKRLMSFILLLPLSVLAHGPTPQKIDESVVIKAPPEKVWAVVREFGDLAGWNPLVKKSEGEGGNVAGAKRVLTLENGETVEESLDSIDEAQREYRYRLAKENLKALPVSSYSATLRVDPLDGAGAKVTWLARAYRGDTGNEPPEPLNDEAARTALQRLFRAGLEQLQSSLEGN